MFAKSLVFWMNHIGQVCSRVFLIPENIFDMNIVMIFANNDIAQSDLTCNGVMIIMLRLACYRWWRCQRDKDQRCRATPK